MRVWRKDHPLTESQKKKSNARSYAHVYLKRGHLKRSNCVKCGKRAEMHHEDYSRPLEIIWLCRKHHLDHHANRYRANKETVSS